MIFCDYSSCSRFIRSRQLSLFVEPLRLSPVNFALLANHQAMKSIFLALAFANQATAAIFPYINITLTPNLTPGNGTKSLSGQLATDISFKTNETVVVLPLTIAGQPSAQYDSESFATDGAGNLPLVTTDATGSSGLASRLWIATRDIVPPGRNLLHRTSP